jgi:hypothetical protein
MLKIRKIEQTYSDPRSLNAKKIRDVHYAIDMLMSLFSAENIRKAARHNRFSGLHCGSLDYFGPPAQPAGRGNTGGLSTLKTDKKE